MASATASSNRRSSPRNLTAALALALLLALGAGGCGSGEGGSGGASPTQATTTSDRDSGAAGRAPKGSIAEEEAGTADQSIQEYGAEAEGGEKEATIAAMRAYFHALADSDHAAICAALTSSNRSQLEQFLRLSQKRSGGCASAVAEVLTPAVSREAEKAVTATIGRVRIGNGNAFVLFRPAGGKLSYFVMKEEDGAWRATSVAPGVPLSP